MSGKFTIQQMLWATLAFAFAAMAMTAAYRGNIVASGVLIAPLFMIVTLATFAAIYWLCYFVCRLLYRPIHTPTPADFSSSPQPAEKLSTDSRYKASTAPAEQDAFTGESE